MRSDTKKILSITLLAIFAIILFVPIPATGKTIASTVVISISNLFMCRSSASKTSTSEKVKTGTSKVANAWRIGLYLTPIGLPYATYKLLTDRENFINSFKGE